MFYKVKKHTYIRIYPDFGYICNVIINKDLVLDNSGKTFLKALSKQSQSLNDICKIIAENFVDVDGAMIRQDVKDFLQFLESEGYIISGISESDIANKEMSHADAIVLVDKNNITNYVPLTKQQQTPSIIFLREYFKKKPHIVSVQIEISNTCNERCIHCYIPHENKTTHLDIGLLKELLSACQDLGVITVLLTGGEPMMHPRFVEILNLVSKYDFEVKILSNLTLLTNEIIDAIKKSNCTGVQVSLYSMDPNIHDSITCKKGSFNKTIDSISALLDAGIPVQLSCVIMKQNKIGYRDVLRWGAERGIITTIDYVLMGRSDYSITNLEHRLELYEVEEIIRETLEYDAIYKNRVINTDIQPFIDSYKGEDNICNVCRTSIGVSANGNVYPCVGWQGYILGNLQEQSLREIWESSPKACALRTLKKEDFADCIDCDKKAFCSMCLVRNANENDGDYLKINRHTCEIAELNKKIVLEYKARHTNSNNYPLYQDINHKY